MPEDACIHIVDDEETVRRALSYYLASAGFASRVYASAEQLMQAAARLAPGCVVTDIRMPGMDGVQLVKRLKDEAFSHPVIVISGQADIGLAVAAMKAGAADFLEKPFRPNLLVEAIRAALEKEGRRLPGNAEIRRSRKLLGTLSPRQRDILDGILEGKLNKTIAHELGLSVRTVEGYRAEIMAKTQARSLSELIRMAVLAGS